MNNCLMWAGASVAAKSNFTLRFTPMVTTFLFTVGGDGTGADPITINSVELLSSSVALSGSFTAQITQGGGTAEIAQRGGGVSYESIPAVVTTGDSRNNCVSITLPANTTISDNKSLTFTLFVYPSGDTTGGNDILDELTIKYSTSVGDRALALKYADTAQEHAGEWVLFPAGRKINITGLQLPAQLDAWRFTASSGNLDDETSDVVVAPVAVVPWIQEDGPTLDGMT